MIKKTIILYLISNSILTYTMEKKALDRLTAYDELDTVLLPINNIVDEKNINKLDAVSVWLEQTNLKDGITLNNIVESKYLDPFISGKSKNTSMVVTKEGEKKIVINNYGVVMSKEHQATSNINHVNEFLNLASDYTNNKIFKLSDNSCDINKALEYYYPKYSSDNEGYPKTFFTKEYDEIKEKTKNPYPLQVSIHATKFPPIITNVIRINQSIEKEQGGFSLSQVGLGSSVSYIIGGSTVFVPTVLFAGLYNLGQYINYNYKYGSLMSKLKDVNDLVQEINQGVKNINLAKYVLKNHME